MCLLQKLCTGPHGKRTKIYLWWFKIEKPIKTELLENRNLCAGSWCTHASK